MSNIGPLESENLSNLILKWYDAQKHQSNKINEGPEIDVINLTWILKALGFKLDFMDFIPESDYPSKEIHIEMKCSVSGLVARLNYKLESCVCPKKKDEQTFWEVQGMAPSSSHPQVKKEETSSSLVPEMSDNCSLVSKAILNNLLKYYKDCVAETGGKVEISEARKKIKIPEMFALNQIKPEEIVVPKVVSQETKVPEINVIPEKKPEATIPEENNKSSSESFIESIKNHETNIVTSSPNEKFDDRDANVVHALNEARSKINQALLYMKLNVTQDISMASSTILMTTPKVKNALRPTPGTPGSIKRSATANEITQHKASAQKAKQTSALSRRSSFGIKPPTNIASPLMGTSAFKRSNSMRTDTPRFKPTGIPSKPSASSLSISNASSLSTSSSSIGSVTSKSSTSKEHFVKPLPGSKKKIVPKAPSLIERFKMQNPVTPKK